MATLTRASKLSTHLSRRSGRSVIPLPFVSHLSTHRDNSISSRSFRGDRRGRRDDDEAEFIQSLDFGDNGGGGGGNKGERSNLSDRNRIPSGRAPNRQWRGDGLNREYGMSSVEGSKNGRLGRERKSRDVDDFFPDSRKDHRFMRESRRNEDRIGDFSESDKEGFEIESPVEGSSPRVERERGGPNWRARALGGTGETLFEKLRLGDKNPEPEQTSGVSETSSDTREMDGTETESSPPPPPQEVEEIFRKMRETGLIPNAVAMLDGLCKDGLVKEAMKLFGVMREKGTIPEVVIYTAVVEAFCKVSRFEDATRVFRKMQKNGVVPNAYSYGVIVNGLSKGGRLAECEDLCMEMFEAGHSPNPATFVGLVDAFCKGKGVEEGKRIVKRFQDRNFAIDEKSIREHLDKKGPFEGPVWEAIFGRKNGRRHF